MPRRSDRGGRRRASYCRPCRTQSGKVDPATVVCACSHLPGRCDLKGRVAHRPPCWDSPRRRDASLIPRRLEQLRRYSVGVRWRPNSSSRSHGSETAWGSQGYLRRVPKRREKADRYWPCEPNRRRAQAWQRSPRSETSFVAREFRRANQIAEHHRELAPFGLEGRWFRSMRARLREPVAAAVTETATRRIASAAPLQGDRPRGLGRRLA